MRGEALLSDTLVRFIGETELEERFRLLIDSVNDYAIFMLDENGRVATWNPGAQRLKGYRAEEIIGQHFSRFYPEDDVRAGKCEHELEVAAREGRFEDEGWRLRKDGTRFWANVVISRMLDAQGKLRGFAKVTRDLTQRLALEEERVARARAETELAEQKVLDTLREQLVGVVGHDLRSPLSAIAMAAGLLLKRGTLSDSDGKLAARIARNADRMAKMISQLLDFTRSRLGGGIPLEPTPLDLAELCAEVIADLEIAHPDRPVSFDPDLNTTGSWDRERLAQVVANLLGNAIQHSPPDTPIALRVFDEGPTVRLEVHNGGPPIPPEVQANVFDAFRQGNPRERAKSESLGLGLYIVREIARGHGGDVAVCSTEAEGTTFRVILPRQPILAERRGG
jgi:PAS domain S-box-containing protein